MQGLGRTYGVNNKSILGIRIALVTEIDKTLWPKVVDQEVAGDIEFINGANFGDVAGSLEIGTYTEVSNDGPNLVAYAQSISVFVPKDDLTVNQWKRKYNRREVVALVYDVNGNVNLVGTLKQPLKLLVNMSKGGGDSNGNTISLTGLTTDNSPQYWTPEVIDGRLRKVFAPGFSYGFLRTE